jgi:RimJ/RimL family protein N-acetyltransferase
MSIIKTHDITLYGGNDTYSIVLRPMSDAHLPLLYKWNADPEVLYWCEEADVTHYEPESVHYIYGMTSQTAYCFIIEANSIPIGECWLQKMNYADILAQHPADTDVRRIDMAIGEKSYWGQGIGTLFIGMLLDFAFNTEHADVVYGLPDDYNLRSQRVFIKNGMRIVAKVPLPDSKKAKEALRLAITRPEYMALRNPSVK